MNQPAPDDSKSWLAGFDFLIDNGSGGSSGPGFTMSPNDARSMLNLAKQARDQFGEMRRHAQILVRTTSPADEPASNNYNAKLVGDGKSGGAFSSGLANTQRMYAYADELVNKLEKALGITHAADESAAGDIKNTGSGPQPTGLAG